jgi:alanyl-tRNA synthetase
VQRSGVDSVASSLLGRAETLGPAKLVAANIGDADIEQLRKLSDRVKEGIGSGVVILGGARDGKATLIVTVTKDLAVTVDAGAVVKRVEGIIDGRGGGRPESASAGGKAPGRLAEAVEAARTDVKERLNGGRG